jgi:hypothetical protein
VVGVDVVAVRKSCPTQKVKHGAESNQGYGTQLNLPNHYHGPMISAAYLHETYATFEFSTIVARESESASMRNAGTWRKVERPSNSSRTVLPRPLRTH